MIRRSVERCSPGHGSCLVAYWRGQKLQQGQVVQGGRWYGTTVVIGNIGKNLIIAHRRQIFRVAPEQLRPATAEELLGVKDMLGGGTFRSKQYVDLVPGHYPPEQQVEPQHFQDDRMDPLAPT